MTTEAREQRRVHRRDVPGRSRAVSAREPVVQAFELVEEGGPGCLGGQRHQAGRSGG